MDNLFFCLGMLYEYIGRSAIPNGKCIEHFFVQESTKAQIFENRLIQALKDNWMTITFDKRYTAVYESSEMFFVDFISEDITDWLQSYFRLEKSKNLSLVELDGSYTKIPGELFIDQNKIITPTQKLSYLRGVFAREGFMNCYSSKNKFWGGFTFVNSYNKFQMVFKLLNDLGFAAEIIENAYGPPHTKTQSIPAYNIINIYSHPRDPEVLQPWWQEE